MCFVNKAKIQECFYNLGHLLKEAKGLLIMKRQMKTKQRTTQPTLRYCSQLSIFFCRGLKNIFIILGNKIFPALSTT